MEKLKIKRINKYELLDVLEFQESEVSLGKTEVKHGKFVEFIPPAKGYFRETHKSQSIHPISANPIIQIKVESLSTSFQW